MIHASAAYGVDEGHEDRGPDGIRALLERHPDLRLFDLPLIPHHDVAQMRGLAQLGLDDAGLRAILHDNAAVLLT